MWFVNFTDKQVQINENNDKYYLEIKNCCFIEKYKELFYILNGKYLYCYFKNNLICKYYMIDESTNKFIINDKIYVSGEDSGCIFSYDLSGNILDVNKMGEHIADFNIKNNIIFCITYHDNNIIKAVKNTYIRKHIKNTPEKIIVDDYIYILSNNEFYSFISLYTLDLIELKTIKFFREIGSIYKFNNKIIFSGSEKIYILNKNLSILSQRKSTGDFLCRFSNIPIFESGKKFDLINNIIYP